MRIADHLAAPVVIRKLDRLVRVLAVDGHASMEIAQRLDINYRTVEIHPTHCHAENWRIQLAGTRAHHRLRLRQAN